MEDLDMQVSFDVMQRSGGPALGMALDGPPIAR